MSADVAVALVQGQPLVAGEEPYLPCLHVGHVHLIQEPALLALLAIMLRTRETSRGKCWHNYVALLIFNNYCMSSSYPVTPPRFKLGARGGYGKEGGGGGGGGGGGMRGA